MKSNLLLGNIIIIIEVLLMFLTSTFVMMKYGQEESTIGVIMFFVSLLLVIPWFIIIAFTANYFGIEVDTSTDNSSCYFCGISKQILTRKIKWEYHDEIFHCSKCHENNRCMK